MKDIVYAVLTILSRNDSQVRAVTRTGLPSLLPTTEDSWIL